MWRHMYRHIDGGLVFPFPNRTRSAGLRFGVTRNSVFVRLMQKEGIRKDALFLVPATGVEPVR